MRIVCYKQDVKKSFPARFSYKLTVFTTYNIFNENTKDSARNYVTTHDVAKLYYFMITMANATYFSFRISHTHSRKRLKNYTIIKWKTKEKTLRYKSFCLPTVPYIYCHDEKNSRFYNKGVACLCCMSSIFLFVLTNHLIVMKARYKLSFDAVFKTRGTRKCRWDYFKFL